MAGGRSDDEDVQLQHALELAYAYLNRRERTVHEMRGALARKGVARQRCDQAVDALQDQGLLDDARFARLFVADKRRLEQWGAERIRRGLESRGIDREVAEAALGEGIAGDEAIAGDVGPGGDPELARALALLRRRFPEPPRDRRERERALGVLLRKGYESELALDALAARARGE